MSRGADRRLGHAHPLTAAAGGRWLTADPVSGRPAALHGRDQPSATRGRQLDDAARGRYPGHRRAATWARPSAWADADVPRVREGTAMQPEAADERDLIAALRRGDEGAF